MWCVLWCRRQISAGCDELRVKYSVTICALLLPFCKFGIDRAGTWLSMCVRVVYAISCNAWIALRTSMLSVATSWWSVITWESKRSMELRRFNEDFSSLCGCCCGGSTSFSSSDRFSWIIFLLFFKLTGLLLMLGGRDFWDFSLSAISVCRLYEEYNFY